MNYYFLIASLPSLSLETPAPLSLAQFEELGRSHLTPRDQSLLAALLHPDPCTSPEHPFLGAWRNCEIRLRNAIAKARAARRNIDPTPYLQPATGLDLTLEKNVADAFARSQPADRELELDRIRWRNADDLAGLDPFAFKALLAYAIKLGLVVRWQALSETKGRERVDHLLAL